MNFDKTWHIPTDVSFLLNAKLWTFFKATARKLNGGGYEWCLCLTLNGYAGVLSKATFGIYIGRLINVIITETAGV